MTSWDGTVRVAMEFVMYNVVVAFMFSVYLNAAFCCPVHAGMMSKENYHRERYSICCLLSEGPNAEALAREHDDYDAVTRTDAELALLFGFKR